MTPRQLLDETIEAHGGRERWARLAVIEASLSSGGLAFLSRFQPNALKGLKIAVRPHERRVTLREFAGQGWRGEWAPDHVAHYDDGGRLVAERNDPRGHFGGLLNQVYWDKLDVLYFAGYALWNYLSFPFLLDSPDVALTGAEAEPRDTTLRLDATFTADFPTHSERQSFYLDAGRRLLRHDYTAVPIGRWATGANLCLASEVVSGLRFYTRRKVFPRLAPRETVIPFPSLVWIEIDNLTMNFPKASAG